MLIKISHDALDGDSFVGLPDESDTEQDYHITVIYYKTWAFNTNKDMILNKNTKEKKYEEPVSFI